MNDVLPHTRPESVYETVVNSINGVSEINKLSLRFNFRDKDYLNVKNEGYSSEFIISKEIEKKPSNVIMKMYDYDSTFIGYDWIIWLLNDIKNPLKELIKGKVLKVYSKEILEQLLVQFKAG